MAGLRILLLGSFDLEHEAEGRMSMTSRNGLQLLSRLAIAPGTALAREYLQDLLWPDVDRRHAQGRFRYLLHSLRKTLGAVDVICCDGDRIYVDPSRTTVDVPLFERYAREGDANALARACALYRGEFLGGLALDAPAFEAWLLQERERLGAIAREVFWRHFQASLRRGDTGAAMHDAHRYLEIDPYCERMHEALVQLHSAQGESALASRQYRRFKQTLERDLHVVPRTGLADLLRPAPAPRHRQRVPAAVPTVAVAQFLTHGDDRTSARIAALITEDVIAGLSRFHALAVVAPDDVSITVAAIAGYVLAGSVRPSDDGVHVHCRLTCTSTGACVWAGQFEYRQLAGGGGPDEITASIAARVAGRICNVELSRNRRQMAADASASDRSLHAYDLFLAAERNHSPAHGRQAVAIAQRVLLDDPTDRLALATIAESIVLANQFVWPYSYDHDLKQAQDAIEQMLVNQPDDNVAYLLLGRIALINRRHDEARNHLQRAVDLNPSDTKPLHYLSWLEGSSRRLDRCCELADLALRLEPLSPGTRSFARWNKAQAAFVAGDHVAGAAYALDSHSDRPHHVGDLGMRAACLAEAGELADARATIDLAKRLGPTYIFNRLQGNSYFKYDSDHRRYVDALRKAAGEG